MADDDIQIERIMTVPLRDMKKAPRTKRAPYAIKLIKKHVAQHMKASEEDIWIDASINEKIWERGIEKPPRKIKIKAQKFEEDDAVDISLAEE